MKHNDLTGKRDGNEPKTGGDKLTEEQQDQLGEGSVTTQV